MFLFCWKENHSYQYFCKKQDKLPPQEKKKAIAVQKEYELRVKSGDYYE